MFISDFSNLSTHVINEINSAVMRNKLIVPVMVSDVKLSPAMEYYISSNHYIKAYDNDNFMSMLVKRVMEVLNKSGEETTDYLDEKENLCSDVLARATNGDAEALCEMGRRFYAGTHGLEKNLIQAFHYFKKAAEQNLVVKLSGLMFLAGFIKSGNLPAQKRTSDTFTSSSSETSPIV